MLASRQTDIVKVPPVAEVLAAKIAWKVLVCGCPIFLSFAVPEITQCPVGRRKSPLVFKNILKPRP